ncbi:CxxC-x17-CxxC domain-containing protein [Allofournierella massiliensis]|uniref:CxxC-x17-CxxC domain-containing protein n=1 Tax=Allofournierella massiliensis TaxID=1650663 RepID=A0A4R1QKD0_9FIRM|nr:CxxC-x17-CxxC domain-containing protein [Fournierella massiliensis]TCL53617.1 CxxC-x17-CxxC domain-containing protein [Fournierella massiliensis]
MYEDKTLVCKDCGKEFVFTAGEQEFYASRGTREMFEATCAACGKVARVPFQPREDRPVYCSECFAKMKENG